MRLSIITDEISQDVASALDYGLGYGIRAFAVRSVWGKNILALTEPELLRLKEVIAGKGVSVSAVLSPLFKCYATDGAAGARADQGFFVNFSFRLEDHLKAVGRTFEITRLLGAPYARIFTFLKTPGVSLNEVEPWVVDRIKGAASEAKKKGVVALIENEHDCYIDTLGQMKSFTQKFFAGESHIGLAVDPGNHHRVRRGDSLAPLVKDMITSAGDLHVKDVDGDGVIVTVGDGVVGWEAIFAEMRGCDYRGFVTLEPHLKGDLRRVGTSVERVLRWIN